MSAGDVSVLRLEFTKPFHDLTCADLLEYPVWAYVPEDIRDPEGPIAPVRLGANRQVPFEAGEVWCLCDARFANGRHHRAVGMCEANGTSGPAALTVFLDSKPLPVPVHEGQNRRFVAHFGLSIDQVFPITFVVDATFMDPPPTRETVIAARAGK